MPAAFRVEAGTRFGRWTVVRELPKSERRTRRKRDVEVRCECGTQRVLALQSLQASRQPSRSCGCLRIDLLMMYGTKHGQCGTPTHISWRNMKARCVNPKASGYKNYGGRGIRVCERWMESFEAFLEDLGPKPSLKHSVERIDNEGNYEPGNVRWATKVEQARNTRTNHRVTHEGRTMTVVEWAEFLGMSYGTLRSRLNRGWSVEKAFTAPTAPGGWVARRMTERPLQTLGLLVRTPTMSATNRGAEREPHDQYNTPSWAIERFLEGGPELPGGVWYEPCAGTGAIVDAVNKHRADVAWMLTEIEEEACKTLRTKYPNTELLWGTALGQTPWDVVPNVVITNPPYLPAYELLNHFLGYFPNAYIVLLLRVNFLASVSRHALMTEYPPDIYVLPNRPSFKGAGKTDATEYAWFVWGPSPRRREVGKLKILELTSLPERRAAMVE